MKYHILVAELRYQWQFTNVTAFLSFFTYLNIIKAMSFKIIVEFFISSILPMLIPSFT